MDSRGCFERIFCQDSPDVILAFSRIRQGNRSLTRESVAGERWFDKNDHWRCLSDTGRLSGHGLHPSSKACAELAIAAYKVSFLADEGFKLATSRTRNLISGGDWSR